LPLSQIPPTQTWFAEHGFPAAVHASVQAPLRQTPPSQTTVKQASTPQTPASQVVNKGQVVTEQMSTHPPEMHSCDAGQLTWAQSGSTQKPPSSAQT
jgi:hypothetical protein